jgi:hypothetical protein
VFFWSHVQPEEEDRADEGAEDEEKVVEKERDEHFNNIRPVIPTKQEWRGHALMTKFDNSGKTGLSVLLF